MLSLLPFPSAARFHGNDYERAGDRCLRVYKDYREVRKRPLPPRHCPPSFPFHNLTICHRGGFSYVVLGNHNETKKDFAIKIFDKKKLSSTELIRLSREMDINGMVDHPAIVKVREMYESDDDVCLVMDLYASL